MRKGHRQERNWAAKVSEEDQKWALHIQDPHTDRSHHINPQSTNREKAHIIQKHDKSETLGDRQKCRMWKQNDGKGTQNGKYGGWGGKECKVEWERTRSMKPPPDCGGPQFKLTTLLEIARLKSDKKITVDMAKQWLDRVRNNIAHDQEGAPSGTGGNGRKYHEY